jgi:hypothetical protein
MQSLPQARLVQSSSKACTPPAGTGGVLRSDGPGRIPRVYACAAQTGHDHGPGNWNERSRAAEEHYLGVTYLGARLDLTVKGY